jgi:hypothetical protein
VDQEPAASPTTTILAEDETKSRRWMHSYLERESFQLLEASSRVDRRGVSPDDPSPSGRRDHAGKEQAQLAQRLSARQPDIKVLFVSGYKHDVIDQLCGPHA